MSFMKVRNNKGPRTVPCGTPEHTGNGSPSFLVYYNSLFAICQERFYPFIGCASYSIVRQFIQEAFMTDLVECLAEI